MHGFASAACAQGYWLRGLTSPHTRLATEHGTSSAGGDSSVAQPEGTAPHVRMQSIAQTRRPTTRQLSHSTKLVTIAATSAAVAMAAQFGSRLTNTWRKQTVAARNSTNHQTDAHHIEKLSLHLVARDSSHCLHCSHESRACRSLHMVAVLHARLWLACGKPQQSRSA